MFVEQAITELLIHNNSIEGKTSSRVDENHNVHFDAHGCDYTFIPDFAQYTMKLHALKNLSAYDRNDLLVFVNRQCSRPSCKVVLDSDCIDIVYEQCFIPIYGLNESMEIDKVILQSQFGRESFSGFVFDAIVMLYGLRDAVVEDFEKTFGKI